MRNPSPKKHHSPKDLCTIEQAEYIANLVARSVVAQHAHQTRPWYRKLWDRLTPSRRRAA